MAKEFPTELLNKYYASFCVSCEIVKGNGAVPLVGPSFLESEWDIKNLKESK